MTHNRDNHVPREGSYGAGGEGSRSGFSFETFDSFPKEIRDAFNYNPLSMGTEGAKFALDLGYSVPSILSMIEEGTSKALAHDKKAIWNIED